MPHLLTGHMRVGGVVNVNIPADSHLESKRSYFPVKLRQKTQRKSAHFPDDEIKLKNFGKFNVSKFSNNNNSPFFNSLTFS